MRNENVELQEKAALANVYADELESLREKSIKVDKYELEMAKLKERIEELQETNSRLEVNFFLYSKWWNFMIKLYL